MKKYINLKNSVVVIIAIALFSFIPSSASAAIVYLESSRNTMAVGDTAIITVKINADGAVLNTVEGDIVLKPSTLNLAVQEFSLANSSFGLWPRTPSLSQDLHIISFVGGVPGGFSIEGATLFKIIVEARKEGKVTISPKDLAAYINDGKGTKVTVGVKDLIINVVPKKANVAVNNEWQTVVSSDKTAPEDFIIVAGQDKTLFDGKKFVFFSALDNQSGIDHYDVSEDGAPVVKSGSTYVPKNQGDNVKLIVTAYDKTGNMKTATYSGESAQPIAWPAIIVIVLIVLVIWFIVKKMRSKKNASPAI